MTIRMRLQGCKPPYRYAGTVQTRLADLAQHVGMSTATVSRVLNGRGNVSEAARKQVLAALDELGYERPRKLRTKSRGLVGLIVPQLENPIYPLFAQVISADLARSGLTPLLCPQDAGGVTEDDYIEMLLDHQVAAIVFVAGHHGDETADKLRYQRLVSAGLPIVLINGYSPQVDAHFVSDDTAAAIEMAIDHLAALDHRRIGLTIGPRRLTPMHRRIEAFTRLLPERFDTADPSASIASSLLSVEGGQAAAGELFDSGHTAVVCGSDYMALGALQAARSRRLHVPDDVSIIGYDDSFLIGFTSPALTTIRQSVLAMGQAAVSIVVGAMASNGPDKAELLYRPELVVRQSTGRAAHSRAAR